MPDDYITILAFTDGELALASVLCAFLVDGAFNELGELERLDILVLLLDESFGFGVSEELGVVVLDDFVEIGYFLLYLLLVGQIVQ